jgi:fimbrial chaperone protein
MAALHLLTRSAWLGLLGLTIASISQAQASGPVAQASGSVSVSPVLIDLTKEKRAAITLRNDRTRAVFYQVSVLRWSQENGQDRYDSTDDFIASPPLFTLAAGLSQAIRLGFRQPSDSANERAYRVILTEVPPAIDQPSKGSQIQWAMQYAIPVFVAGSTPTVPSPLTWQMHQQGNTMHVRADNPSNRRVVLSAVGLSPASSPSTEPPQPHHTQDQRATVLAHAWREWRIPLQPADLQAAAAPDWRIRIKTPDNAVWQAVSVADMRMGMR